MNDMHAVILKPENRPTTWQTITVSAAELPRTVDQIRHAGGVITSSRPVSGDYDLTYVA